MFLGQNVVGFPCDIKLTVMTLLMMLCLQNQQLRKKYCAPAQKKNADVFCSLLEIAHAVHKKNMAS